MERLGFSDGMSFDTSGPYRIIQKTDGLYVVGHGLLMGVDTREEGQEFLDEMAEAEKNDRKGFTSPASDVYEGVT